jgi:hypothetical protein
MSFSVEPRFGIDRIVLDKDALDGVKGRELGCVADLVKVVYHGVIELPEKASWPPVFSGTGTEAVLQ